MIVAAETVWENKTVIAVKIPTITFVGVNEINKVDDPIVVFPEVQVLEDPVTELKLNVNDDPVVEGVQENKRLDPL